MFPPENFKIDCSSDMHSFELYGALKLVIALGAGARTWSENLQILHYYTYLYHVTKPGLIVPFVYIREYWQSTFFYLFSPINRIGKICVRQFMNRLKFGCLPRASLILFMFMQAYGTEL